MSSLFTSPFPNGMNAPFHAFPQGYYNADYHRAQQNTAAAAATTQQCYYSGANSVSSNLIYSNQQVGGGERHDFNARGRQPPSACTHSGGRGAAAGEASAEEGASSESDGNAAAKTNPTLNSNAVGRGGGHCRRGVGHSSGLFLTAAAVASLHDYHANKELPKAGGSATNSNDTSSTGSIREGERSGKKGPQKGGTCPLHVGEAGSPSPAAASHPPLPLPSNDAFRNAFRSALQEKKAPTAEYDGLPCSPNPLAAQCSWGGFAACPLTPPTPYTANTAMMGGAVSTCTVDSMTCSVVAMPATPQTLVTPSTNLKGAGRKDEGFGSFPNAIPSFTSFTPNPASVATFPSPHIGCATPSGFRNITQTAVNAASYNAGSDLNELSLPTAATVTSSITYEAATVSSSPFTHAHATARGQHDPYSMAGSSSTSRGRSTSPGEGGGGPTPRGGCDTNAYTTPTTAIPPQQQQHSRGGPFFPWASPAAYTPFSHQPPPYTAASQCLPPQYHLASPPLPPPAYTASHPNATTTTTTARNALAAATPSSTKLSSSKKRRMRRMLLETNILMHRHVDGIIAELDEDAEEEKGEGKH